MEMEPAREAEEPPGSPALPAEEPQGGQPVGAPPGEEALPAAAGRERGVRGAGPQGPGGRAARGRGRRGGGESGRAGRRPRVTVDSSKAKTSLEALKISLRQLRWREVSARPGLCPFPPALPSAPRTALPEVLGHPPLRCPGLCRWRSAPPRSPPARTSPEQPPAPGGSSRPLRLFLIRCRVWKLI